MENREGENSKAENRRLEYNVEATVGKGDGGFIETISVESYSAPTSWYLRLSHSLRLWVCVSVRVYCSWVRRRWRKPLWFIPTGSIVSERWVMSLMEKIQQRKISRKYTDRINHDPPTSRALLPSFPLSSSLAHFAFSLCLRNSMPSLIQI